MKNSQNLGSSFGDDENRGKIRNRGRSNQIKDFSGLRYGKITPTDIDGLIDFGDKAFVLMELKYLDAPILAGQKLAIERLADAITRSKRRCLTLIARHDVGDPDGEIDVANCTVAEYRSNGIWKRPSRTITVREFVDWFLKQSAPRYLVQ